MNLVKEWWNWFKRMLVFISWWPSHSIVSGDSYSGIWLDKLGGFKYILMIVFWPVEWVVSLCILFFSFGLAMLWIVLPLFILAAIGGGFYDAEGAGFSLGGMMARLLYIAIMFLIYVPVFYLIKKAEKRYKV